MRKIYRLELTYRNRYDKTSYIHIPRKQSFIKTKLMLTIIYTNQDKRVKIVCSLKHGKPKMTLYRKKVSKKYKEEVRVSMQEK